MELCDKAAVDLIKAAAGEQTDVFLLPSRMPSGRELVFFSQCPEGGTAIVFPREPVIPKNVPALVYRNGVFYGESSRKLLFADAGSFADDEFTGFLRKNGFRRLIVPFADAAAPFAGAHSGQMSLIGEYRASVPEYVQLIAVFASDMTGETEKDFVRIFSCGRYAVAGTPSKRGMRSVEFLSREGTFHFAADECEKRGEGRTAVFFNDRLNAVDFVRFMKKRGTPCAVFHGGMTYEEKKNALNTFSSDENGVIAATGAFLPTSLFCDIRNAVFCGIPSEIGYNQMIRSAVPGGEDLLWTFCPDDIKRAAGSIYSYASFLPESEKEIFLRLRMRALENILKQIK